MKSLSTTGSVEAGCPLPKKIHYNGAKKCGDNHTQPGTNLQGFEKKILRGLPSHSPALMPHDQCGSGFLTPVAHQLEIILSSF